MNKPILKYNVMGFKGCQGCKNFLLNIMASKYKLLHDSKNPKIIFCNCKTNVHRRKFKFIKKKFKNSKIVFFTGENVRLALNLCHFGISFDYLSNPRQFRYPLWLLYTNGGRTLIRNGDVNNINKPFFCGFVAGHSVKYRDNFVKKLSKYKKVLCPGKVLNNFPRIGPSKDAKLNFLKKCKFTICFENSSHNGYVTEKIVHPFMAHSIPIYWGSRSIGKEFNKKAFLNRHDYKTDEQFIRKIIEIDKNNKLYHQMLNEKPFITNDIPVYVKNRSLENKLLSLVN